MSQAEEETSGTINMYGVGRWGAVQHCVKAGHIKGDNAHAYIDIPSSPHALHVCYYSEAGREDPNPTHPSSTACAH